MDAPAEESGLSWSQSYKTKEGVYTGTLSRARSWPRLDLYLPVHPAYCKLPFLRLTLCNIRLTDMFEENDFHRLHPVVIIFYLLCNSGQCIVQSFFPTNRDVLDLLAVVDQIVYYSLCKYTLDKMWDTYMIYLMINGEPFCTLSSSINTLYSLHSLFLHMEEPSHVPMFIWTTAL